LIQESDLSDCPDLAIGDSMGDFFDSIDPTRTSEANVAAEGQ
jgi:hypothetical protein